MERRILAVVGALALAACSGGGGGGGATGGGGGGPLSGTLKGAAFVPAGGGGLEIAPTSCSFATTIYGSALILGFADFADVCGFAQQSHVCDQKASATLLTFTIVSFGASPQAPIGPGTYALGSTASLEVDSSYSVTSATCVDSVPGTVTASGTVTISSLSGGRATGSADVAFSDGSHVSGTFDVALCAYAADLCAIASGSCTCSAMNCCI
jgi:hypothetical protein